MEILNGLRSYFDKALPAMLLYRQEREQYAEAVPEDSPVPPSFIYGAEHLLRLFGKDKSSLEVVFSLHKCAC